jgi:hypothetical protein
MDSIDDIIFYEKFIRINKTIYENTKVVLKYKDALSSLEAKAFKINHILEKYINDEQHYRDRGINIHIHDIIQNKKEELFHIKSDIEYIQTKIKGLSYDFDIYDTYIKVENHLHFHKVNL